MSLPSDFGKGRVTGRWVASDGTPARGSVVLTPTPDRILSAADETIVLRSPITFDLDDQGAIDVEVLATDDPDMNPTGWTYRVVERFTNVEGRTYACEVPEGGRTVLSDIVQPPQYTAGSTITRGPAGPPGPPLIPEGTVTTAAALPAEAVMGAVYIADDTGHAHAWTFDGWVDLGQFRGPPGEPGATLGFSAGQAAEGSQVLRKAYQPINGRDIGMVGDDSTSDTTKFGDAINAALLAGGVLFLPRGKYRLPGFSRNVTQKVRIVGERGTHLIGSSGSTAFTIGAGGSLEIENCEISGFAGHFCSPGAAANGGLVRFRNVWFHDIGNRDTPGGGGVYAGAGGPVEFEMDRCTVEDCYWGIRDWSDVVVRASVTNSVIRRVGRSAIRFGVDSTDGTDTVRNIVIHSNHIEDVTHTVDDTSSSSPYNADGIRVTGARDVSIKGNTIVNVYNLPGYSGDNCQAIYTKANGVLIEGNTIRNAGRNAGSIVCKGGQGDASQMGRGAKVHNNTITVDEDHAHQTAMSSAIRMESWKGSITDNHITGFVQSSSGIISMQGESNLGAWRDEWVIARNVFYDWGTGTGNCTAIYIQGEKNFTIDANVAMPGGSNGSDDSFIRLVPGSNQSQHQKRFAITNNKVYGITKTTSDPDSAKFLHVDYAATSALTSLVVDGNITFDTNMFIDFEINAGGVVNSMTVTNNHCFGLESPAHFVSNGSQAPAMIRMGNFANSVPVDGLRLGNGTVAGSAHFGGTAAPAAGLGIDGDWYWRTDGTVYKKASGSWSTVTFGGGGGSWDGGTVTGATTFTNSAGTTFDKGTTGRTVVGGDSQWLSVYKNDTDTHPSIGFGYFGTAPVLTFGSGEAAPNVWLGPLEGVLTLYGGTANLPLIRNTPTAKTANYTLTTTDHLAVVRLGNGSGLTLTIPTNATVAIPVGAEIGVQNEGNAMWTIAGAGGVSVRGVLHLGVDQHATLVKTGTDAWFVRGPSHVVVSQAEWDALDGASAFSTGAVYSVGN